MNAEPRLAALRRTLASNGVDAMLVLRSSDMRYLTGFEGVFDPSLDAACLVTAERAWFVTDFRYREAAQRAAEGSPWTVRIREKPMLEEVCEAACDESVITLAVESSISHARWRWLEEHREGALVAVEGWVERLRRVKEAAEIELIEAAARIADESFAHILGFIKPDATELDIALELEFHMRRSGSEGVAFEPIVASGPNSAMPHAGVTRRVIGTGDLVKIDFGAVVGGYRSDMTRTVVVGRASDRQREVYEAVLAANEAGLAAVRAGVRGRDADAVARELLASRGFGEAFGHGLGHGVGLDVHEGPTLGPRSDDLLHAGEVVTVEPGVYLEGFGGVRIEDLVVVEDGGCRLLDRTPKSLIEV